MNTPMANQAILHYFADTIDDSCIKVYPFKRWTFLCEQGEFFFGGRDGRAAQGGVCRK
jgi:hypothetical protein